MLSHGLNAPSRGVSPSTASSRLRPLVRTPKPQSRRMPTVNDDPEDHVGIQLTTIKSHIVLLQARIDALLPLLAHRPVTASGISNDMMELEATLLRIDSKDDDRRRKEAKAALYELLLQKSAELGRIIERAWNEASFPTLRGCGPAPDDGRSVTPERLRHLAGAPLSALPALQSHQPFPGSPMAAVAVDVPTEPFLRGLFSMADLCLLALQQSTAEEEAAQAAGPAVVVIDTLPAEGVGVDLREAMLEMPLMPLPRTEEFEPPGTPTAKHEVSHKGQSARELRRMRTEGRRESKVVRPPEDPKEARLDPKEQSQGPSRAEKALMDQVTRLEEEKEALARGMVKLDLFLKETARSEAMRVGFDGLSDELCQELNLQVLDGRLSLLDREKAEGDHEEAKPPPPPPTPTPKPKAAAKPAKSKAGAGKDSDELSEEQEAIHTLTLVIGMQQSVLRQLQAHFLKERAARRQEAHAAQRQTAQLREELVAVKEALSSTTIAFEREAAKARQEAAEQRGRAEALAATARDSKLHRLGQLALVTKWDASEGELELKEELVKRDAFITDLQRQVQELEAAVEGRDTEIGTLSDKLSEMQAAMDNAELRTKNMMENLKAAHAEAEKQHKLLEKERAYRAMKAEEAGTHAMAVRDIAHQLRETEAAKRRLEEEASLHNAAMEQVKSTAAATQRQLQSRIKQLHLMLSDVEFTHYKQLLVPLNASVDHFLRLATERALHRHSSADGNDLAQLKMQLTNVQQEFQRWAKSRDWQAAADGDVSETSLPAYSPASSPRAAVRSPAASSLSPFSPSRSKQAMR